MTFDFAKVKAQARRVVHETLGVSAFYKDSSLSAPVEIKARWHNKIVRQGDLENQGYAEVYESADRIVFSVADARALNVKRGGVVSFVDGPSFTLATMSPSTGPVEEVWEVTPL